MTVSENAAPGHPFLNKNVAFEQVSRVQFYSKPMISCIGKLRFYRYFWCSLLIWKALVETLFFAGFEKWTAYISQWTSRIVSRVGIVGELARSITKSKSELLIHFLENYFNYLFCRKTDVRYSEVFISQWTNKFCCSEASFIYLVVWRQSQKKVDHFIHAFFP